METRGAAEWSKSGVGEGLWWALATLACSCLGNGPAVYFVAGSRLTLFLKCSFPTAGKDAPLASSLLRRKWALLLGKALPAWHFCQVPCPLRAGPVLVSHVAHLSPLPQESRTGSGPCQGRGLPKVPLSLGSIGACRSLRGAGRGRWP